MADEKITQKTALTTPAGEDLLYIVDDPSGTPIGKKITLTNLFENVPGTIDLTGITDGNVPYMSASGFADSPLTVDGTDVVLGATSADALLHVASDGIMIGSGKNSDGFYASVLGNWYLYNRTLAVFTWDSASNDTQRFAIGRNADIVSVEVENANLKVNSTQLWVDYADSAVGINTNTPSANADLTLEGGAIALKETTTPSADTNYGKVYTKSDNKLYFQDGAGSEHTVAFV